MESLFSDADSFISYDDSISHPASGYQAWQSSKERGGREKSFVCSGVSAIGKKPSFFVLFNNKHSLLVQSSASWQLPVIDYCGAWRRCGIIWKCLWNRSCSRVFESAFVSLYWKKENLSGPLGDGSSFGLFSGEWSLYLGQILQSVSFALYMSASVECFAETSDERLKSFSISIGLTISSVIGTVCANMAGGKLCDLFYPEFLILFSFLLNLLFFILVFLKERLDNKKMQC
jgi:MFS family permease